MGLSGWSIKLLPSSADALDMGKILEAGNAADRILEDRQREARLKHKRVSRLLSMIGRTRDGRYLT